MMIKKCLICKNEFRTFPSVNSKFCSRKCYWVSLKNHTPWNKGTKGVMKTNRTSFKKGQNAWNKGLKRWWKSSTEFKKGIIPWNKFLTKVEQKLRCKIRDNTNYRFGYLRNIRNCEICNSNKNKEIHHKLYRFPTRKEDIIIVCKKCHVNEDKKR